ncbi:Zinc (Zn2)-Iron (Fe2) Permease, partial [Phytophthora megakarya]
MVVFSKRLVYLANPVSLAVALSISSGVMMFISLVEIFGESVHLLTEGIHTEGMSEETATGHGWLAAT